MIEARGMPTTVVGLVRLHMEKSQPPRGLWTPFQLGRPLGEPGDAAFQKRVLRQALKLLERTDGPSILEDFTEDAANWADTPGWQSPAAVPAPASPATPGEWAAALSAEMALVRPHWAEARRRFGRTTVGVGQRAPEAWPDLVASFLAGGLPPGPSAGLAAPALALRFAVDDIKAFYSEAAMSDGKPGSARQIDAWFWRETLAGRALKALREFGMASENSALKTVAGRFFVPAPWLG
jgi:hypothetical protein